MSNEQTRTEFIPGLLSATGWDFHDTIAVQFYNAILLRDFGPWKKGQAVECISFNYAADEFVATEWDKDGLIVNRCEFTLQPLAWKVSK